MTSSDTDSYSNNSITSSHRDSQGSTSSRRRVRFSIQSTSTVVDDNEDAQDGEENRCKDFNSRNITFERTRMSELHGKWCHRKDQNDEPSARTVLQEGSNVDSENYEQSPDSQRCAKLSLRKSASPRPHIPQLPYLGRKSRQRRVQRLLNEQRIRRNDDSCTDDDTVRKSTNDPLSSQEEEKEEEEYRQPQEVSKQKQERRPHHYGNQPHHVRPEGKETRRNDDRNENNCGVVQNVIKNGPQRCRNSRTRQTNKLIVEDDLLSGGTYSTVSASSMFSGGSNLSPTVSAKSQDKNSHHGVDFILNIDWDTIRQRTMTF